MKKGLLLCIFIALFCAFNVRGQEQAQPSPTPGVAPASNGTAPTTNPSVDAAPTTVEATKVGAPAAQPVGLPSPMERAQPVRLVRFEKPPVIDGKLDDEVWNQAAVFDRFFQTQPGDNIQPSQPTIMKMGYDSKNLYLAFQASEQPGRVRATVAKRDDILEDDNVRVYLDTFNDKRRAYIFIFNPLGVQQDGIQAEGTGADYSVDVVMESRGMVTPEGYTVEVAIPFKSLRYKAGKDQPWGLHVFRNLKYHNDEENSWMPIFRDKSGFLTQQGQITGIEGITGERTLEVIPSLTLSETGKRVRALPQRVFPNDPLLSTSPDRFVNQPLDFDPGLTAKLSISSAMVLDLAINPDFAQVEADQTVITANQRFPIFFEEKRPFFLEGIDIFRTLLTPVHTRAIIDPDVAVKFTGKQGRNTYGLLFASDNAPGNYSEEERTDPDILPGIQRFLDKNSYIGVLRLKRDVGKENSLGLIATTYNFIERHNHLGGFDGRFRINPQTTLQFQVLGTHSRRFYYDPDQNRNIYRTGNALGYAYRYEMTGRHFSYGLFGNGRTRDYRADVGFTRRININNKELMLRYNSEPKTKGRLVSWQLFNLAQAQFNFQGRSQFFNNNSQVSFNFRRQSYLGFGFQQGYERIFEDEFGARRSAARAGAFAGDDNERSVNRKVFYIFAGTTPSKKYSFYTEAVYTKGAFDFDFGNGLRYPRVSPAALLDPDAPLDPGPGNELFIVAGATYQPTDTLRLSLDYTKSRLTRHDTGLVAFDDNIFAFRATQQFTRFTFLRARADYDTLAANIRAQLLFGYTPNPGTAFYVGYNDDLNRNGFNPFTGNLEPGFRRNGRTFFIKMSYLFRRSW
ncbi:MAG TPA: DUF5916 domain-containing protein [Pyrinomonadaceae bacterium]|jgi:hypothetical protein